METGSSEGAPGLEAPAPRGEGEAGAAVGGGKSTLRRLREVAVAIAVVGLTVAAVMSLPLSLNAALVLLVLFAAGAIVEDGRPVARHGLRWPPRRFPAAHAFTLVAFPVGIALAYGANQLSAFAGTGRWLAPLDQLRLELFPYFFGSHVVWAALPEELLFRGYLETRVRAALGGGLRSRRRGLLTVLAVGLLNVLAHAPLMDARSLLGVGLLGLALSYFRERTGSLAGPFACHAAYNATLAWMAVSHV